MGLKEFMANRRVKKNEKLVERCGKRLMNKWTPTAERKRTIEQLYEAGTSAAAEAMLKRYTYRTDGAIVDEDEKSMVYERILAMGALALEPLIEYIKREETVYWPLKALVEIGGQDLAISTLLEAIEAISESYGTDLKRKTQLVSNLREFQDERVFEVLKACLNDDADEIRFLAVDGITVFGEEKAARYLVERLCDPDETARVRTQILELLVENQWKIHKKQKPKIAGNMPPNYWIGDTGTVKRK